MSMRRTESPIALVFGGLLITVLLSGCDPDPGPTPSGTATPTATSAAPVPSETATPTVDPAPPEPAPAMSSADRANIRDAITSGNTAAIEGYLADPVAFVIMASECCEDLSPAEAAAGLDYVTGAPGPWNFALPAATVAEWRTNYYYGSLFTGDDIVGRASDGTIVAFGIEGSQVVSILMGFEEGFSH